MALKLLESNCESPTSCFSSPHPEAKRPNSSAPSRVAQGVCEKNIKLQELLEERLVYEVVLLAAGHIRKNPADRCRARGSTTSR
jgi:hypothetical protein